MQSIQHCEFQHSSCITGACLHVPNDAAKSCSLADVLTYVPVMAKCNSPLKALLPGGLKEEFNFRADQLPEFRRRLDHTLAHIHRGLQKQRF
jgi:hypothetical protein